MTAVNSEENLADAPFNPGADIGARMVPKLIRALRLQANQLNSPNRSNSPVMDESIAAIRVNILVS